MNLTYRLSSWAFAESSPSHSMRLRVLSEHIAATSRSVAWMWWTDWPSLILGETSPSSLESSSAPSRLPDLGSLLLASASRSAEA